MRWCQNSRHDKKLKKNGKPHTVWTHGAGLCWPCCQPGPLCCPFMAWTPVAVTHVIAVCVQPAIVRTLGL
jgi:hypothetical protein